MPCLADGRVNHCDEAIVLLAHPDKHKLHEAAAAVEIEYESLPAVFTLDESERRETIVWGEDNFFKKFLLEKGDVDAAWARASHIVEGEYRTGAQEHLYIENNGVIAEYDAEAGVTVRGSLQCPYYVHRSLLAVFGLPEDKVRVIQTETGGAFGGKEDYPSILCVACGIVGNEEWPCSEDGLRPHGRSGCDDQAPSIASAAQDCRGRRGQIAGDGDCD